ncbi:hypothetical protein DWX17_13925 [[Clostridium] innocuum]|nr:hypothetical protein DWX17_13925 [[Clostridium] innocuum]
MLTETEIRSSFHFKADTLRILSADNCRIKTISLMIIAKTEMYSLYTCSLYAIQQLFIHVL